MTIVPRRRERYTRKITWQTGSNAFHWTMVALTGGLWFLVWPLFRRTRVVTVRRSR